MTGASFTAVIFIVTVSLIDETLRTGEIVPTKPYNHIPPVVEARLRHLISESNYPIATLSMYFAMVLWTQIHGIIYLEVYNHIQANVDDVGVFYETQVRNMLIAMGLKTAS